MVEKPTKKINNATASGTATSTPQGGMAITFGEIPKEPTQEAIVLNKPLFSRES